jgi:Cu-Zn family superoxide dismutase
MRKTSAFLISLLALSASSAVFAADPPASVSIYALTDTGVGDPIGTIDLKNSKDGLVLTPKLSHLPPGQHGIHIHQLPDCRAVEKDGQSVAGLAAGGHFDPAQTGKHLGPTGDGHKGDLPFLTVDDKGEATKPLVAPHLTVADVEDHAIVIHAGGDNYSDDPKPLGGGGPRIACGVVK